MVLVKVKNQDITINNKFRAIEQIFGLSKNILGAAAYKFVPSSSD